ncbi:MAG: flagellar protein FlaG [Zoogloeaceae bacterium]|jgi:flagellar protein FlaG|nr:flagellar protein FlaG [Zoogloeaceae bacterium]
MDIASIGGAAPAPTAPQGPQQGRAPVAPVSRETLANDAGVSKGAADSARNAPPVNTPVVGKEESSAPDWQRQPGVDAQTILSSQNRRGQVASQTNVQQQEAVSGRTVASDETGQAKEDLEELQKGVDNLNAFITPYNTSLNFSVDKESGRLVVKVIDKETEEVVKQFPSEEALRISRSLEQLQGLLVQQKA